MINTAPAHAPVAMPAIVPLWAVLLGAGEVVSAAAAAVDVLDDGVALPVPDNGVVIVCIVVGEDF